MLILQTEYNIMFTSISDKGWSSEARGLSSIQMRAPRLRKTLKFILVSNNEAFFQLDILKILILNIFIDKICRWSVRFRDGFNGHGITKIVKNGQVLIK